MSGKSGLSADAQPFDSQMSWADVSKAMCTMRNISSHLLLFAFPDKHPYCLLHLLSCCRDHTCLLKNKSMRLAYSSWLCLWHHHPAGRENRAVHPDIPPVNLCQSLFKLLKQLLLMLRPGLESPNFPALCPEPELSQSLLCSPWGVKGISPHRFFRLSLLPC